MGGRWWGGGGGRLPVPFVFSVDVRSVVQQVLHHGHAVVAGGKVQRRGVAPLQVAAVHIRRVTQLLCPHRHKSGYKGTDA